MFHLFKKVYIDFDNKINMSYDRIICSDEYGGKKDSLELSKVFYGELLASEKTVEDLFGKNKPYESLFDMLEQLNKRVDDYNNRVFIYCDRESYYKLSIMWLKIILPNCDANHAWKFFKSHIFKEKNFVNSRLSGGTRFANNSESWMLLEAEFKQYWDNTDTSKLNKVKRKALLEKVITSMKIEFLLSSYLYDGRYAEQFAKAITPLVRKDLENFLYEQKEIILVHFQRPKFQELLKIQDGPYDFDNFYDMINDTSPLVEVMFKPEIWGETKSSMYIPSSSGTINFDEITDQDIELIKEYSEIVASVWTDHKWYSIVRSENDKFDFIKILRDKEYLSVEDLNKILDYEIHNQNHNAGTFYAIDLRTVNTYFVDFILQNHDNKDKLKPYIFEI